MGKSTGKACSAWSAAGWMALAVFAAPQASGQNTPKVPSVASPSRADQLGMGALKVRVMDETGGPGKVRGTGGVR